MTLPRKREDIIDELLNIKRESIGTQDGRLVRAICILTEVILDKEDYVTFEENDSSELFDV